MNEVNIPLTVVDNNQVVGMEAGAGVIKAVSPTVDLERVTTPNPGVKITVKDVRGEYSETVLDGSAGDPSALIDDTAAAAGKTYSSNKIEAELTPIKSDLTSISEDVGFLNNYITPQMHDAAADGVTDDTNAINAAAADAIEKGLPLYFPEGQYKCTGNINLRYVKRIKSDGVINLTTDGTWVTVGDSSVNGIFCDIHIASATRVKVVGLLDSKVYVGYAQELMLYADGEDDDGHAVAYNTLQGEFVSKITLMSNKESETVGWVNDNLFEFRRIIHILIDGNYKHNNNVFRNCGIEGNAATIDIPMGHSNKIICRGESLPLTNITIGADCFNNQILKSWGNPGLTGGYLDHMIGIQRKNYYGMIWDQLRTYYSIINIDRNHKCFSGMQGYLDDNGQMYAYSGQTWVKVDHYVIPNASQVEVVLSASDARFSLKNVQLHGADGAALTLTSDIVEGGGINTYYGQKTAQFTSGAYRLLNFTITDPATVRYISFELITTSGYSGNFEFVTVKFVTNKIFTYNPIMAPIEIKSYANAAPLRGNWEVGEIVYNASPAPGGYVGWICTTAGKSGTWKGFGLIES